MSSFYETASPVMHYNIDPYPLRYLKPQPMLTATATYVDIENVILVIKADYQAKVVVDYLVLLKLTQTKYRLLLTFYIII